MMPEELFLAFLFSTYSMIDSLDQGYFLCLRITVTMLDSLTIEQIFIEEESKWSLMITASFQLYYSSLYCHLHPVNYSRIHRHHKYRHHPHYWLVLNSFFLKYDLNAAGTK